MRKGLEPDRTMGKAITLRTTGYIMCERLPGNRCANHVKTNIDKKVRTGIEILVSAGVDSPDQLTGRDKQKYDQNRAELEEARSELKYTPPEIRKLSAKAGRARAAVTRARAKGVAAEELERLNDAANKLESEAFEVKAMRKRRRDGLRKLERTEASLKKRTGSAVYQKDLAQRASDDVTGRVKEAIINGSGDKDILARQAIDREVSSARRDLYELKKKQSEYEKTYSRAVDSENVDEQNNTLSLMERNTIAQGYQNERIKQCAVESQKVDNLMNPPRVPASKASTSASSAKPAPAPVAPRAWSCGHSC